MKHYYLEWKRTLNELNDFSSKVEFLQSRIRNNVIINKNLDIEKYLDSLKTYVNNHEIKLHQIGGYHDRKFNGNDNKFVKKDIEHEVINIKTIVY